MVTKEEIDIFFTKHDSAIEFIISTTKNKCKSPNKESIKSELYLLCVDKAESIKELSLNWIKYLAATEYRWSNSQTNRINAIFAGDIQANELQIKEEEYQEEVLELDYLLQKYLQKAKPSEKLFFDLYVNKGVRSVRKVKEALKISHQSAWILINDFKTKIKSYER